MLIFGFGDTQLLSKEINICCHNCNSENTSKINVTANYFHLFWIPFFPLNKKVNIVCSACNFKTDLAGLPLEFKEKADRLKNSTKTPKWLFAGTFFAAIVITLIAMFSTFDSMRKTGIEELINEPMAGDIYEIKTLDNYYSLLTIVEVSGDSIFACFHNYDTKDKSGLTELYKTKDFNRQAYLYFKDDLIYKFRDGLILNIIRGTPDLDFEYVIQEEPGLKPDDAKGVLDAQSGAKKTESAKPADK